MQFNLNEEQLAFQKAARDFSLGELVPYAAQWDDEKIFPVKTIAGQSIAVSPMISNHPAGNAGES